MTYSRQSRFPLSRRNRLTAVAGLLLSAWFGACDGQLRGPEPGDAIGEGPVSQTQAVAVRMDAPSDGVDLPSLSLLSFKAHTRGIGAEDVLAAVDPLLAAAPRGSCVIRKVDETADLLRQRRGAVELQAIGNLSVKMTGTAVELRPVPRVYPDLARVVAGVVGEAGPVAIPTSGMVPELSVAFDSGRAEKIALPRTAHITRAGGGPLARGAAPTDAQDAPSPISVRDDLDLEVSAERGAFIEVRPFGTTSWAACPVEFLSPDTGGAATTADGELPRGRVVIPSSILQKLARESGEVPVSFDVVWRYNNVVEMPGPPVLLSVEVRTSALVELAP